MTNIEQIRKSIKHGYSPSHMADLLGYRQYVFNFKLKNDNFDLVDISKLMNAGVIYKPRQLCETPDKTTNSFDLIKRLESMKKLRNGKKNLKFFDMGFNEAINQIINEV